MPHKEKTEADIEILAAAREKFKKCVHANIIYEIGDCKLYNYTMETTMDMLHHCGSCKTNKSKPTTTKIIVRSR